MPQMRRCRQGAGFLQEKNAPTGKRAGWETRRNLRKISPPRLGPRGRPRACAPGTRHVAPRPHPLRRMRPAGQPRRHATQEMGRRAGPKSRKMTGKAASALRSSRVADVLVRIRQPKPPAQPRPHSRGGAWRSIAFAQDAPAPRLRRFGRPGTGFCRQASWLTACRPPTVPAAARPARSGRSQTACSGGSGYSPAAISPRQKR